MTALQRAAKQMLEAVENANIRYDSHGNPWDENDAALIAASKALQQALEIETMKCNHDSQRRVILLSEALGQSGVWQKSTEKEFCADCNAPISIKSYSGAFLIDPEYRTSIIRDDRPIKK
jgi:hypothetical protein